MASAETAFGLYLGAYLGYAALATATTTCRHTAAAGFTSGVGGKHNERETRASHGTGGDSQRGEQAALGQTAVVSALQDVARGSQLGHRRDPADADTGGRAAVRLSNQEPPHPGRSFSGPPPNHAAQTALQPYEGCACSLGFAVRGTTSFRPARTRGTLTSTESTRGPEPDLASTPAASASEGVQHQALGNSGRPRQRSARLRGGLAGLGSAPTLHGGRPAARAASMTGPASSVRSRRRSYGAEPSTRPGRWCLARVAQPPDPWCLAPCYNRLVALAGL